MSKKEQTITYTIGLPASGKSTWAKEQVEKSHGKIKRVNKDDLRHMMDNYKFSKPNEAFVLKTRDFLIQEALIMGYSVIVDDTNFGKKHAVRFQEIADEYSEVHGKPCKVICQDFTDVSVKECIARDKNRSAMVGEKVIMRMYNQFVKKDPEKYVPPEDGLPTCVICDLDGTLALLNGRSPYDATNCDKDEVNEAVAQTLLAFKNVGYHIVFMSGREDKYREPTLRFLDICGLRLDSRTSLHMRVTDDNRKDSIVKKEMFYANVHGRFNPLVWIDDRQQVVDMTRNELGVPVFQVAEGLF